MEPSERLYQLGRLIVFYKIDAKDLLQVFPYERLPLPFLEAGHICIKEWGELIDDAFSSSPEIIGNEIYKMLDCLLLTHNVYNGPLNDWIGERCLITNFHNIMGSTVVNHLEDLWQVLIEKSYSFSAIHFLHPPWLGDPPLFQKIWSKKEMPERFLEVETVLKKAIQDPTQLNPEEIKIFLERMEELKQTRNFRLPDFVEFPQPFEHSFAYGVKIFNLKHPVTQALVKFVASLDLAKKQKNLSEDSIGHLEDSLRIFIDTINFPYAMCYGKYTKAFSNFLRSLNIIWSAVQKVQLFDIGEIDDLAISQKDWLCLIFG